MVRLQRMGELLALAGTVALVACAVARGTGESLAACRGSGSGGGFAAEGEHELIYSVSHDSTGPRLGAAVLVHAPSEWSRRQAPESQPEQWRPPGGPPRMMNSATAGPLWIGHEPSTGTVWVDSVPVPLHGDNVLLLEIGPDDEPRVAGRARVESKLPVMAGSCGPARTREEAEAFQQSLWATVRRAPQVREFLDR